MFETVVFALILLHGPDGREVDVSIDEITHLQCKMPDRENALFAPGVNTVVNLTDGRFVSVKETCNEVRNLITDKQQ